MANNVIKGAGFHHVALKSTDFDKSMEFYKAIGMELIREWGEGDARGAMLDFGDGGILELFAGGVKNNYDLRDKYLKDNIDEIPQFEAGIWGHLALTTDDIDSAYDNAIKAGAVSAKSPMTMTVASKVPMNIHIAFVVGLDGELIEFFKVLD